MDAPNIYSNYLVDAGPGTKGAIRWERSYECCKCHLGFKESQVAFFKGKPYGVPCGCAKDIDKLVLRGRG